MSSRSGQPSQDPAGEMTVKDVPAPFTTIVSPGLPPPKLTAVAFERWLPFTVARTRSDLACGTRKERCPGDDDDPVGWGAHRDDGGCGVDRERSAVAAGCRPGMEDGGDRVGVGPTRDAILGASGRNGRCGRRR